MPLYTMNWSRTSHRSVRHEAPRSSQRVARLRSAVAAAALLLLAATPAVTVASSTFTYQGRLELNGTLVSGTCNMRFQLFDALNAGNQVGGTLGPMAVTVTGGLFSTPLDFGGAALGTGNRWIETAVECPPGAGLVLLTPRQPLSATPYAYFSDTVAAGSVGTAQLQDTAVTAAKIAGGTITANQVDSSSVQRRVTADCTASGGALIKINSDGTATCGGGDIIGVTAGDGLTGGGTSGTVTLNAKLGGSGSSTFVSRVDHDHVADSWSGNPMTRGQFPLPLPVLTLENTGNGQGLLGKSDGGVGVSAMTTSGLAVRAQSASGNLFEGFAGANLRFRVTNTGTVTADGTITGGGADFAEMLPGASALEPGDVLVIGADGGLVRSATPRDSHVAGVYSTKPGFLGGGGEGVDQAGKVPLAVVGIVPVKVTDENGRIGAGDLLVSSSTPGHAMKADVHPPTGTVIGKALAPFNGGKGVVSMLVVLQ